MSNHLHKMMGTYFLLDKKNNIVKIGQSKNLPNRLYTISTSYPFELELIGVHSNPKSESDFHRMFFEFRLPSSLIHDGYLRRLKHREGEWFRFAPEIQNFIENHLDSYVLESTRKEVAKKLAVKLEKARSEQRREENKIFKREEKIRKETKRIQEKSEKQKRLTLKELEQIGLTVDTLPEKRNDETIFPILPMEINKQFLFYADKIRLRKLIINYGETQLKNRVAEEKHGIPLYK